MSDWLLAFWLTCAFLFDMFLLGGCAYITFWRGQSKAWWILAVAMSFCNGTLFKALGKRFGVIQ